MSSISYSVAGLFAGIGGIELDLQDELEARGVEWPTGSLTPRRSGFLSVVSA